MIELPLFTTIANIATAVGVLLAAWQLWLSRKQSITTFEDSFSREYRELAAKLPTKALLGQPLSEDEYKGHFDEFYHYFDLCNEQAFLHQCGRISQITWKFWRDGIASNLRRPAFAVFGVVNQPLTDLSGIGLALTMVLSGAALERVGGLCSPCFLFLFLHHLHQFLHGLPRLAGTGAVNQASGRANSRGG